MTIGAEFKSTMEENTKDFCVDWIDFFDRWLFDGDQAVRVDSLMKRYAACYLDLGIKRSDLVKRLDMIPKPETREDAKITHAMHEEIRQILVEMSHLFDELYSCKVGYHDGNYSENSCSHGIGLTE